ncbi:type II toxin-antitoxin system HicA family toxin [Acidithiobacillus sulfuriphilus]|uniref:Type II toxin-antitoxin system HicA family toxin n=2 Tax=Acidithiobacillus sulfuriphilus TaxID=1867749 RepID=A0A3M8RTY3_9PROT|nr:type II toxin-antitoxin system HicA family toxin [Acidithiobacillus sulfuriphilus]RNF70270.1 type II toxin-antitoxin system HicA family toxin [Acidithiobacillus sulfuriphilus]
MGKHEKIQTAVLSGRSDANIAFADLLSLLGGLGFLLRVKGDHHVLTKEGVAEIINLQPIGRMVKPYQVKQVRGILTKYRLGVNDDE